MSRNRRRILPTLAAALAAACAADAFTPTTPAGPTQADEASLKVISLAPAEAPPESLTVSFWAKSGSKTEKRLYLAATGGASHAAGAALDESESRGHGKEYLRLTIGKRALLRRPNGTPFAAGDSVLIIIHVLDRARMLFQLDPAGLEFSSTDPAELRIRFQLAGEDIDHNGHHDNADDDAIDHLGVWRQVTPTSSFERLPSDVSRHSGDVRANLPGFSRYAIAY